MKLQLIHRFIAHAGPVYCMASGPDANTVYSGSSDKMVACWNLQLLKAVPPAINITSAVYSISFDRVLNKLIAGNSEGEFYVVNLTTKMEERHIVHHRAGIFDLCIDYESGYLYIAGGDGVFSVWSWPGIELIRSIPLTDSKIRQIALNRAEGLVALACGDGVIRILENKFFNELHTINAHADGVSSVAWHPSKPVLISGGKDAILRVWKKENDIYNELLAIPAHNFAIYSIAFSPDGLFMSTASRDKTIKIWDAVQLSVLQKIDNRSGGHSHSVNKVLWTDTDMMVSCSDDRSVNVYKRSE